MSLQTKPFARAPCSSSWNLAWQRGEILPVSHSGFIKVSLLRCWLWVSSAVLRLGDKMQLGSCAWEGR